MGLDKCIVTCIHHNGLPWWLNGKELTGQCKRCGFDSRVRKIFWRRNGSPLQYSCLENPTDWGAPWATVCCCSCLVTSVVSNSVGSYGLQPARILFPWDSPDKSTRVGALLQGIFPIQGLNQGLLHCRQILYHWVTREALGYSLWGHKRLRHDLASKQQQ